MSDKLGALSEPQGVALDYQAFWDRFHDSAYHNPSQRHRFRLIAAEVDRILKIENQHSRKIRLIDLGCGLGHLIHHLQKKYPAIDYSGTDISDKAITELKKNIPGVKWASANLENPASKEAKKFDIVICSEVLEHCEKPNKVLLSAAECVAPGGWLIVTVPGGRRYRIDEDLGHLRHYQLDELKKFFVEPPIRFQRGYAWGWPFLNAMRAVTNHFYGFATSHFLSQKYGWKQKLICQWLYVLMFANIFGQGCQLVGVYKKFAQSENHDQSK